ncbi:hypothetical protein HK096_005078, partial [Nowakowskiella sp. JEL0078]
MWIDKARILILAAFVNCAASITLNSSTTLPSTSNFANSYNFTILPRGSLSTLSKSNGFFSIHWKVDNQYQANATLRVLLQLKSVVKPDTTFQPWMGIGFGSSMLDATFIICHSQPAGVDVHEHQTNGIYSIPKKYIPIAQREKWIVKAVDGGHLDDGTFFCLFTRPVLPTVVVDPILQPNITAAAIHGTRQDLLWAYNPASVKDYLGTYFAYHEVNGDRETHGVTTLDWEFGNVVAGTVPNLTLKQVHGFGAVVVWLIIFPFAAFYARYLRSTPGWVIIHIVLQSVGVAAFFALAAIGIMNVKLWYRPHYILGLTLSALLLVQASLGATNRVQLASENGVESRKYIRLPHRFLGLLILVTAVVQAILGLNTLNAFEDPANLGYWVMLIIIVSFFLFLFISGEIYMLFLRLKADRDNSEENVSISAAKIGKRKSENPTTNNIQDIEMKEKKEHKNIKRKGIESRKNILMKATEEKLEQISSNLKKFTWSELDNEVKGGKILVVGNGRFVYDASQWIGSHPGGQ